MPQAVLLTAELPDKATTPVPMCAPATEPNELLEALPQSTVLCFFDVDDSCARNPVRLK